MEQHEVRGRADQHGTELGYVASHQRWEVRVCHETACHQPKHYAAYPYAQRCLQAERAYLPRIVTCVVSEGPERILQIAVRVSQGQGNEIVEDEYLGAAGWVDQQQ